MDFNYAEKLDTNNFLTSLYKSWVYVQKREPEKTLSCLKNAIALNPNGVATFEIPKWLSNKEHKFLKKTIEANINSKNALEGTILNIITQNDKTAFRIADSLRLQYSNSCVVFYILSLLHEKQTNSSAAISAINEAIKCNSTEAIYYLKRAELFHSQNNFNQACEDYLSFIDYTDKYYLNLTFRDCFNLALDYNKFE